MSLEIIKSRFNSAIELKKHVLEDIGILNTLQVIADEIVDCFRNEGHVYFAGNGGSAADAQHLAAELSGKFYLDRNSLGAEALHCNTSYLTAVANDFSYDEVYSRLIKGLGRKGDIVVGLSTTGNSENIVNLFNTSQKLGIKTIAITGGDGGRLTKMSDLCIIVPSHDTPRIQEVHITIGHIICELVESSLFSSTLTD
jgi:D-sedoheptulose 7-phosphate isomerase